MRLSLSLFSSAAEEGPSEAAACHALLCCGKGDQRCGEKAEFIKHICNTLSCFIQILWWTMMASGCRCHKPLNHEKDAGPFLKYGFFEEKTREESEWKPWPKRKKEAQNLRFLKFPNEDQDTLYIGNRTPSILHHHWLQKGGLKPHHRTLVSNQDCHSYL